MEATYMKKSLSVLCMTILILGMAGVAGATSFTPSPRADLWDLDHSHYYTWGIDWSLPEDEEIESVSLNFYNIYNWQEEANDLYVHLLGEQTTPSSSDSYAYENYEPYRQRAGDYFENHYSDEHSLLTHWENLPGGKNNALPVLTYNFSQDDIDTLLAFSDDGNFGIGFDPDCHFYNTGVELIINTKSYDPIPEPGTVFLLSFGLLTLAALKRRWKR
jgi:hypothetical protein